MMDKNFLNRSFLKLLDFNNDEIVYLLELSARLKEEKEQGKEKQYLAGKNIALIFEKTSTRTRCAFEVAAYDQGANVTYLGPTGSQIGHKESMKDTARVLGRMYDGIEYRGYGQEIVEQLSEYAGVPVWNGLTTDFHPTQILADILTVREHLQKPLNKTSIAFLGDAKNNVANSLMVGASILGMDYRAVAPVSCQPAQQLTDTCREISKSSGANISVTDNVAEGVKNVDFIYTDVWVSMGESSEVWKERIRLLKPYQVNEKLMALCNNNNVKLLHCLPSFHNKETKIGADIFNAYGMDALEVTDEVFEANANIIFDQAENRMHTIKAVMVATLAGEV